MENILQNLRSLDFRIFKSIYESGLDDRLFGGFYYFFSKYAILLFFLSFIYLIWNKRINALICSALATATAGGIDLIIYMFWRRPRPYITHADVVSTAVSGFRVDSTSFPSSHTYIAFAIATAIYFYGHKRLGSILYVLAVFVAIARVGTGLHYPSDVIGGALLGIASGIVAYLIVTKMEKYWK